jgi:PAS domain S-box-containing protein
MGNAEAPASTNGRPAGGAATVSPAHRFFDLSVDLLCVAGVDGYFKSVNSTWTRMLGYTDAELKAVPYIDFVHPDDREATLIQGSKIAAGSPAVHFRNRYRCKDGSYRWLAWTSSGATPDGLVYAGARDVTDDVVAEHRSRELLREQAERIRHVLQSDALKPVYQPIVDIARGKALGWEALSRFQCEPKRSPDQWFAEADAIGLGQALELRAIEVIMATAGELPAGAFLSVNASPDTIVSRQFHELISRPRSFRLVVEVTEHAAVENYDRLTQAVGQLRLKGVRLAIDDAGAGFASLRHIVKLLPEFVKLDLFLTRDIDTDAAKRAVTSALSAFTAQIGANLIAEGVERAGELRVLAELGVEAAQGYYLGRPAPKPAPPIKRLLYPFGG